MKNPIRLIAIACMLVLGGTVACEKTPVQDFNPPLDQQSQTSEQSANALAMRAAVNTDSTRQNDKDGDGDIDPALDDCFEFTFPIELNLPGEGSKQASNDDEIDLILEEWFAKNPNSQELPSLAFPVSIELADGTLLTVDSEEVLDSVFHLCYSEDELLFDEDDWGYDVAEEEDEDSEEAEDEEDEFDSEWENSLGDGECFEWVFPLTVSLPDGKTETALDEDELELIFDAWFESLPEPSDSLSAELVFPTFAFPIQVMLRDSSLLQVTSEEELMKIELQCFEDLLSSCMEVVFPISLVYPDGSSVTINSLEEGIEAIDSWLHENPDNEEDLEIVFPIEVKMGEELITVEDDDMLDDLFDTCFEGWEEIDGASLITGGSKTAAANAIIHMQ